MWSFIRCFLNHLVHLFLRVSWCNDSWNTWAASKCSQFSTVSSHKISFLITKPKNVCTTAYEIDEFRKKYSSCPPFPLPLSSLGVSWCGDSWNTWAAITPQSVSKCSLIQSREVKLTKTVHNLVEQPKCLNSSCAYQNFIFAVYQYFLSMSFSLHFSSFKKIYLFFFFKRLTVFYVAFKPHLQRYS